MGRERVGTEEQGGSGAMRMEIVGQSFPMFMVSLAKNRHVKSNKIEKNS